MAISVTANIVNGAANLSITCDAGAVVSVRQRVRFIGTGKEGHLVQPGDMVVTTPDSVYSIGADYYFPSRPTLNPTKVEGSLGIQHNSPEGFHPEDYIAPYYSTYSLPWRIHGGGGAISNSPEGKHYIGIAFNKSTPNKSNDYRDYYWDNIGRTTSYTYSPGFIAPDPYHPGDYFYTSIVYADTPTTGMSNLPAGKSYIGVHYNSNYTKSTNYSDYTWSPLADAAGFSGVVGSNTYTWIKYATFEDFVFLDTDSIWRGTDGSAPILSPGSIHVGNWDTPLCDYFPAGYPLTAWDHIDKSFSTDVPGCTVVCQQWGVAHSWSAPVECIWDAPDEGSGLGSMSENVSYGVPAGEQVDFGWGLWSVVKPDAGSIGNTIGRFKQFNTWDDGHWWWQVHLYALRPKTYEVSGSGTLRTATATGVLPGDVIDVVNELGETATLIIPNAVTTGDLSVVTSLSSPQLTGIIPSTNLQTTATVSVATLSKQLIAGSLSSSSAVLAAELSPYVGPLLADGLEASATLDSASLLYIAPLSSEPLQTSATLDAGYLEMIGGINAPVLESSVTMEGGGLVGTLLSDDVLTTASVAESMLYGVLWAEDLAATSIILPSTLSLSSGSIRSPSGEILLLRTIDGVPITLKRYVSGTWQ